MRPLSVDTFDDGDLAEYGVAEASWSVTTGAARSGTHGLHGDRPSGTSGFSLRSTSGLPYYPQAGDTFEYVFQMPVSGDNWAFVFGVQSLTSNNGRYEINVDMSASALELEYDDVGTTSESNVATAAVSWSTATWYRIVVGWATDGTITITLSNDENGTEIVSFSGVESTFTSGGIGGYISDATEVYIDTIQITDR